MKQKKSNNKEKVLIELKKIDKERYKYVLSMYEKIDRYKDYIFNSFENYWKPKRIAQGIILMDS